MKRFFRLFFCLLFIFLLTCCSSVNGMPGESPESTSNAKESVYADRLSDATDSSEPSENVTEESVISDTEECNTATESNSSNNGTLSSNETLTDGVDIRVMSWNLLMQTADYSVESRYEYAVETIKCYQPDVIGTQETCSEWLFYLDFCLPEYTFVTGNTETGGENYSTLWYNKKTVRVVEYGVHNYSVGASKKLRLVTWAVFERILSGERFIVTSTHWDRDVESEGGENIYVQAEELAALLYEIREQYPVPAFCTGDYNRTPSTQQYQYFLSLSGFSDAPRVAESVKREYPTYHTVGDTTLRVGIIDHIFCSSDAQVLLYNTVMDSAAIQASDHCPIYIDLKLSMN